MVISDYDAESIPDLVKEYIPSASMDYTLENMPVYDVVFNDDYNSNNKGINGTYEECMNWIEFCRNDKSTYFGDYKGGTVSIIDIETGEHVYTEEI